MRKFLLTLLMLLPGYAAAQDYSGVWAIEAEEKSEFYSIHQDGDQIVVAVLNSLNAGWAAYQGSLVENVAKFEPLYTPGGVVTFSVRFLSATQGVVEVTVPPCNAGPGTACAAYSGYAIKIEKIL